jgi:hemerythrin
MTTFTLPWIQDLALAADELDDDHRRLLDKLNTLLRAVSSRDKTRVLMAFSNLRAEAQEHFAMEEAQMRDLQYPDMEKHCESHRHLLDGLSTLRFTLDAAERFGSTTGPCVFLERWFVAHLTNDDKKLAEFLARRAPEAPAAAG